MATVTSKGQITIPVEVRRSLGLKAGSRVDFVRIDDSTDEVVSVTGTVRALKGCVAAPATPVTIEQMDEAIAEAASRDAAR